MKKLKTYRKTMTRDNGFIVQEAWSYALEEGFKSVAGFANPHSPFSVYHIVDGANEIWEHDKAFSLFQGYLLKANKKYPQFLNNLIKAYNKFLKEMRLHRKALSLKSLQVFAEQVHYASYLFVLIYYTAYDERTPKKIRDKALKWREQDEFYDTAENIIKKSIAKNFLKAKGLELVVGTKDLEKMPSKKELQQRFKECIYIPRVLQKNISLKKFQSRNKDYKFIIEQPKPKTTKLKGQVASPGHAQGKVRILRRKDQVKEFQTGEILLSPMTTPDYVPAMKKAGAIVTDEGGITCHAAIVARELDKPCLIGTKFATEIFKDGDMVEVDTDKGIIKKI